MKSAHLSTGGSFFFGVLLLGGCIGKISGPLQPQGVPGAGPGDPQTMQAPPTPETCGPSTGQSVGHYTLRRLTNAELTNTVQDLLFVTARPGDALQASPAGSSGYTNDSNALSVYSALITTDYAQAEAIAHSILATKGTAGGPYSKLVTCNPSDSSCAQATVKALARRALRRAVTADDLDPAAGLMAVFTAGGTFDQGLNDVIVSLLMHPEFLLIPVLDSKSLDPSATFALTDDEVAARLSYFLWQSMPDDALFAAADAKTLHDPAVLKAQVQRMLQSPRARHLSATLRDEYAELGAFATRDFTQLGQSNALRDAMYGGTGAFFDDLVANDRSASSILDSKLTFANKTLADFYGLTFPSGAGAATFVPISSDRTGLAAQGAVLVNTAGGSPTFTNPVKRGHWLVKKMLCIPPPPPPPNVPPLPAATQGASTIRDRLAAHVANPACQGCHVNMDQLGLGAENYDAFGRWRVSYDDGTAVDASGTFPDGTAFTDSKQMVEKMASQSLAQTCVAEQFYDLALSRALSPDERCGALHSAQATVVGGAHLSDLLTAVATSPSFLNQVGEAP